MTIQTLPIEGPLVISPKCFGDTRGFFTELFNHRNFHQLGVPVSFVQDNFSRSHFRVLRGLHFQNQPPQAKLVTCLRGRIFDVIVDLRPDSPSFGQHYSVILDSTSLTWFWIPSGFAHGFQVLSSEGADVLYKVDQYWQKDGEGCLKWDDPEFNIPWPTPNPIVSEKDLHGLSWVELQQRLSQPKLKSAL